MATGSLYLHIHGPATQNVLSPNEVRGTSSDAIVDYLDGRRVTWGPIYKDSYDVLMKKLRPRKFLGKCQKNC